MRNKSLTILNIIAGSMAVGGAICFIAMLYKHVPTTPLTGAMMMISLFLVAGGLMGMTMIKEG